ncbi:MAG: M28 family metallopeptidase [Rhodothermales bacterium]
MLYTSGCSSDSDHLSVPSIALESFSEEEFTEDIKVLASDEFEGRGPSSAGEEKTVNYLAERFSSLGLEPGNGDSYFQQVPLVNITAAPDMLMYVEDETGRSSYSYGDDFMVWTKRVTDKVDLDFSELVFVGYGVTAPEYDWYDYEGLDVKGKTVVMLINDPGFGGEDPAFFRGNSMTYYGRWTYKFEEAARQGAAAALIIHETKPASYPWEVVSGSWSGAQFDLVADDKNMGRVAVEGWLHIDTATEIFENAGLDLDQLKTQAKTSDFQAVSLRLNASLSIVNTLEFSESRNVIAVLPGSKHPDEYIINMAHWDHFGVDPSLEGDQIYNGALDNATGTAGIIALAKAYAALPEKPDRSVAFLAVTAEEQGLLGSKYYGQNPIYDLKKTVAAFNLDAMNTFGPTRDVVVVGYGNSELDDYVEAVAKERGRYVQPDPEPEKGYFYRSDHFAFAKEGVPALYTGAGIDHIEHGEEYGRAQRQDYTANRYHKPSDEYDESWDLSGAIEDLKLTFITSYRVANAANYPAWKDGTEFKAKREADLAQ